MTQVSTIVIGVGSLGQHHARIMAHHPQARLLGLIDTDRQRAAKIAAAYHVNAYASRAEIPEPIAAAVVAVPTPLHYAVTRDLLDAGIHCLVEKPFTATVAEAEELIALARHKNLVLQVGHVERFNPAVVAAQPFIHKPKFIEVNRLGPYDPRTSHIGVVLDLMIHDLDIVLSLVREKIVSLEAHGASILSEHEDLAKVRITFAGGCVADLSASRVSLEKYRKIRIFQQDSYLSIDYAGKSLKIYRRKNPVVTSLADIDVVKPKLTEAEPLFQELSHFLACVREGKKPLVSGEHGRDALELGFDILRKLQ